MKAYPVATTHPAKTIRSSWISLTLLAVIAVASACKPLTRQKTNLKSDRSSQSGEVYVAFNQPVHQDVATFLSVVRGSKNGETIKLSVLQLIPRIMSEDIVVSEQISMNGVLGDGPKVEIFIPVQFGGRVFIFRMISQGQFGAFDSMPDTYLASQPIRERVRSYLSTKYTETDRIARLNATLDTIEFLARAFPGVDGVDRAINSTGSEQLMGVVSAVGDVASFGVGSKLKLVAKGAQAVVVTAATVRLSVAAAKAANGTATYATGIDAALAATEVGLSAVTFVKLKISKGGRAVIESAEGAELVGKQVGKSADDVLAKGLDSNDLSKLGIDVSKYSDEASDLIASLRRQFPDGDVLPIPTGITVREGSYAVVAGNRATSLIPQEVLTPELSSLIAQRRVGVVVDDSARLAIYRGSEKTGATINGAENSFGYLVLLDDLQVDRLGSGPGAFLLPPGVSADDLARTIGPEGIARKYAIREEFRNPLNEKVTVTIKKGNIIGLAHARSLPLDGDITRDVSTLAANEILEGGGIQIEFLAAKTITAGDGTRDAAIETARSIREAVARGDISFSPSTKLNTAPVDYQKLKARQ